MRISKTVKLLSACTLALCMLFGAASTANAASSDKWKINYTPGAPSNISNQVDDLYVSYYSGGFIADCKTISGTNGRALKITAKNAGGMKTVSVTTATATRVFKTEKSTSNNVCFQVTAVSGYSCKSTGTIKIAE